MSANHDQVFVRTFLVVLGSLVAFTAVIYVIAQMVTADDRDVSYLEERKARVQEHTQPVFQVVTDPDAIQQVAMTDTSGETGGEPKSGTQVYEGLCSGCHASGVAGAPRTDDTGVWSGRLSDGGKQELYDNAINGLNAMPAKGGDPSLSDEEVKAAVDYILEQSGA